MRAKKPISLSSDRIPPLKEFYKEIEWRKLLEGKEVQKKYEVFLSKYKRG